MGRGVYLSMNINIWLTKKCNLQCTYCYEGIAKETELMSKTICDKVISYVQEINEPINIRFHGGEPLLEYSKLQYLYERLKRNKNVKTFGLTTNGIMLDENKIDFLVEAMNDFSISIDGTKEVHDKHRKDASGKGTYDKVCKVIPQILKKNPYARARMTITTDTIPYLYESVKNIVELGFKVIAMAVDVFDPGWNDETKTQYLIQVSKIKNEYCKNSNLHIGVIERENIKRLASCGGGKDSIHISTDGMFYPCSYAVGVKDFAIGNLEKGIVEEKVREIECIGQRTSSVCEGCMVYDFCPGTRCKIINKIVSGNYDVPPIATCMDMNVRIGVLY